MTTVEFFPFRFDPFSILRQVEARFTVRFGMKKLLILLLLISLAKAWADQPNSLFIMADTDPGEAKDFAKQYPEVVKEFEAACLAFKGDDG